MPQASSAQDDAASLLDALCTTEPAPAGPSPRRAAAAAGSDIFHTPDGTLILCQACKVEKMHPDEIDSSETMAWNFHGFPHDATTHSRVCFYCENRP